jgi:hypothetical protein
MIVLVKGLNILSHWLRHPSIVYEWRIAVSILKVNISGIQARRDSCFGMKEPAQLVFRRLILDVRDRLVSGQLVMLSKPSIILSIPAELMP